MLRRRAPPTLFPYTTLFRSLHERATQGNPGDWLFGRGWIESRWSPPVFPTRKDLDAAAPDRPVRSEEHTSELQSRRDLVCRLLLEKKKTICVVIPSMCAPLH